MQFADLLVREAIRYTVALYNQHGDAREYEKLVDVFHPEAEMAIHAGRSLKGVPEIIDGLRSGAVTRGAFESGNFQRHHITTSMIEVTGENMATAKHYIIVVTELGLDHTGIYIDEFVPYGARWLIKKRQATMEWARSDSRFARWLGKPTPS